MGPHALGIHIFAFALLALSKSSSASRRTLFEGATILAFDAGTSSIDVIRSGSLLVEEDRIIDVFRGATPRHIRTLHDVEIVDSRGKIISPGFVDCHHHLWQTLFKTLESNTTLATYFALYGETGPAEQYFTHEDSYISQLMGALESLNAGVTTIVDHAHGLWSNGTADAILGANIDSGARIFYGFAIHNLTNGWSIEEQMAKLEAMLSEALYVNTPTSLGVAFDFFNSMPEEVVTQVADLARHKGASFITSHYVGGPYLTDNSPEVLDSYGILNDSTPVLLSHSSFITERGRQLLRDTNQYMVTTPESELQLTFATHERSALIQDQAALGIDTNWIFSADLLTQARMWLQMLRGIKSSPVQNEGDWPTTNPMSVNQAFLLATQHGGLALRRPDIGVIAPGAKADLVVFSTSSPALQGWNDPVAAILLHAGVGDIEDVLVDGNFVKRNGKLTYPHYQHQTVKRFAQARDRIQELWVAMPQPNFTGQEFLNRTAYATVPEIDIQRESNTGYGVLQVAVGNSSSAY